MKNFRGLFFPNRCLACGNVLSSQENCFCLSCAVKLPRTHFDQQPNNLAEQLFYGRCDIERAASFCYFEKGSGFRKAIHQFKYYDSPRTAWRLGNFYARELSQSNWQDRIDVIVPVPIHWTKKLQRGYNQSEWIARGVAAAWSKPVCLNTLHKHALTATQTRKSLYDRYLNAHGSIRVVNQGLLAHKHVLLVDDVLTSGATLEACIEAMREIAGVKISILTLGFAE